ncbi:hypothetical protein [Clostridium sp. HMP27]|uniref:hypothetical protein n=1 Tax=Clostridium sp. HMP27 TaxID=1487921 RepID=UPI00052B79D2|nr:hypothetical protein [Clostridium sp. HMP27]KGK88002.1 hypothetical protein DP68_08690 [Clostridium sp. HMP27]
MDHLIDQFDAFIDFDFNCFYEELKSGKYGTKYSDQPTYPSLKATIDSVNILRKYMGWNMLSIKEMVAEREEN